MSKISKALKKEKTPTKAKKTKATLPKNPAKAKASPKSPKPSSEPEETGLTPPHTPFVYSPSDSQETLFNQNRYSDLTSEPEDEKEPHYKPGALIGAEVELWDIHRINHICNHHGAFTVPTRYPESYPIIYKQGSAGFVHKGYIFNYNDEKKPLCHHHYKCDTLGCPTRLSTYGFT